MNSTIKPLLTSLAFGPLLCVAVASTAPAQPAIARRVPPSGVSLSVEQERAIQEKLSEIEKRLAMVVDHPLLPDVELFSKAVSYALRHGEFYQQGDVTRALTTLQVATERLDLLLSGRSPWTTATGLIMRGYRSRIDDSVQPYGLVIPADLKFEEPVPLYVWLHGRGDKITDLHFIHRRRTQTGVISPPGAIVLHPFGRQCIGFKSAGEVDVLEAIEHVAGQYPVDRDRIVLMGFSMGGAGAWHLGAHYADDCAPGNVHAR